MSLLETESQLCTLIRSASVPDGEGGEITQYMDTTKFNAVVTPTNYKSNTKEIGNTEIPAATVKIMYPKDVFLKLHDVIRTEEDGKTYRVTTDAAKTVKSSNIGYSLTTAEEWGLTND